MNPNLNLILNLNPNHRTLQDKTVAEGVVTRRHDIKVPTVQKRPIIGGKETYYTNETYYRRKREVW